MHGARRPPGAISRAWKFPRGLEIHRRRAGVSPGSARLFRGRAAHRHPHAHERGKAAAKGGLDPLAEDSAQQRLGRRDVAATFRRHRLERHTTAYFRGGEGGHRRASAECIFAADAGAGADGIRQRRAAGIFPAENHHRRRLVVPGIFRTGLRLRSRFAADQRGAPGRSLSRQRPEDLEHPGPVRRLDILPGAHRHRGAAAAGHFVSSDRHEIARDHAQAHHHAGRRERDQRDLVRRCAGAGTAIWSAKRTRAGPTRNSC